MTVTYGSSTTTTTATPVTTSIAIETSILQTNSGAVNGNPDYKRYLEERFQSALLGGLDAREEKVRV